jgi:hypothetical protein
MATIFLSHSSLDQAFAHQLCEDLTVVGHKPWVCDVNIRPGEPIVSAIEDGIVASRYVIVVVSKAAIQSRWVDAEWKEKLWDPITTHRIRIIPVLREACDMPLFLRTLRHADFTRSYAVGFATLCLTIGAATPESPNLLNREFLHAIEHAARTHGEDHIRLACIHTIWSCRPDRAKPILEDAMHDFRDVVRDHAKALYEQFY